MYLTDQIRCIHMTRYHGILLMSATSCDFNLALTHDTAKPSKQTPDKPVPLLIEGRGGAYLEDSVGITSLSS